MADSDTKHPETTVPEGDGVVCHSQTAGRKVTLARHTQENGVEHGDLEPSWRSPTRRVYTLDVQTGSSLLIRQNTANNLVSPDIFIGISVYKLYIGFIYRNTAPPLALMRFNTRTFFSKLLGMYLRAFLRLGGF